MKKAKVILTGLVVLAVVGGAVAFKSRALNYCVYQQDGGEVCPRLNFTASEISSGSTFTNATTRAYSGCPTSVANADCNQQFNTSKDY